MAVETLITLAVALLLSPLAGYAVGRTVTSEDLFIPLRNRVVNGPYIKVKDVDGVEHFLYPEENSHNNESPRTGKSWFFANDEDSTAYEVLVETEEGVEPTLVIRRPNAYKSGFTGWLKGTLGELIAECDKCSSVNATVWFTIISLVVGFVFSPAAAAVALAPFASVSLAYFWYGLNAKITREPSRTIVV